VKSPQDWHRSSGGMFLIPICFLLLVTSSAVDLVLRPRQILSGTGSCWFSLFIYQLECKIRFFILCPIKIRFNSKFYAGSLKVTYTTGPRNKHTKMEIRDRISLIGDLALRTTVGVAPIIRGQSPSQYGVSSEKYSNRTCCEWSRMLWFVMDT
jgi:hypothetical protein